MEVSAVIHVLRHGIDYRIVARGVQLFLYHLTAVRECVKDRTKYLRSTAQRVVRLHFVLEYAVLLYAFDFRLSTFDLIQHVLTFLQALAACAQSAHLLGYAYLTVVTPIFVQRRSHQVVITAGNLVHPHRGKRRMAQQILGMQLIDTAYAGHYTRAVRAAQTFAYMDADRLQPALCQHFGCRTPLALVMHLSLAYQTQRYMRQLHQIAARTYAAVLWNVRIDPAVDKLGQQRHQLRMHTALALCKRTDSCEHARAYKKVPERFTHTCGMRAYDIILQVAQVIVTHAPLCHRAEARIDSVNHLVMGKLLQKFVTVRYAVKSGFVPLQTAVSVQEVVYY